MQSKTKKVSNSKPKTKKAPSKKPKANKTSPTTIFDENFIERLQQIAEKSNRDCSCRRCPDCGGRLPSNVWVKHHHLLDPNLHWTMSS